jgi:hypothetical protein
VWPKPHLLSAQSGVGQFKHDGVKAASGRADARSLSQSHSRRSTAPSRSEHLLQAYIPVI